MQQEENVSQLSKERILLVKMLLNSITEEECRELNHFVNNNYDFRELRNQAMEQLPVDNYYSADELIQEADRRRQERWTLKGWLKYFLNSVSALQHWVRWNTLPKEVKNRILADEELMKMELNACCKPNNEIQSEA